MDVDDLKSGLDEQCEATSTKTHAIQGESEDNIISDEGTPNFTASTLAVQQTTTRCSGRTRRAPQLFGDYVTGSELADPKWKAAMDKEFKWKKMVCGNSRTRHHQQKIAFCSQPR